MKVVVGDRPANWINEHFRPDWLSQKYLAWMCLFACAWPRRWQPSQKLTGDNHIEFALAEGRGVLVLTSRFAFKDLMAKVSLALAGYKPRQLSHQSHGFSDGLLTRWFLNPIYKNVEDRFLEERLEFSGKQTEHAKTTIKERLKDNQLVIVAAMPAGRKVSTLPFLHGQIKIATGAINIACDMNAPILPSFTIRNSDGEVQTIVEHPLDMPATGGREEAINHMLADYVRRLETYVARYPEQFVFPISSDHGDMMIQPLQESAASA